MILSVEKLYKRYSGREVLIDCSFQIGVGQCVLLRGPSGGGKSTLLRILSRLEQADSGRVIHGSESWDAKQPLHVSPYPFLTLVFQQLFLWPNLTMSQNLGLVLEHRPSTRLDSAAMPLLERFTIANLLDRYPHQCSLGERQRFAIARALLSDTRFLLLDEPSSALDRVNRGILAQELSAAVARNRGVLIVTHDDASFEGMADQSFEIENGRLEQI